MRDLHYQADGGGSPLTLHRYEYGYDAAGNRLHARVTQAPGLDGLSPVSHENDRSYLYGYDALQRLTYAGLGALDAENDELQTGGGNPVPRESAWTLDILGNWSGNPSGPGAPPGLLESGDLDLDGAADADRETSHATDARNEIGGIDFTGYPPDPNDPNTTGAGVSPVVYDAAGNLAFDGSFWYQYDAWCRLLQVNAAGTLTADDFLDHAAGAARGKLDPGRDPGNQPGVVVVRLMYDGVGRLVRLDRPMPEGYTSPWRKERYVYDGVRRIGTQVNTPPLADPGGMGAMGDWFGDGFWGDPNDPNGFGGFGAMMDGFGGDPEWTDTEYVYGPDYVDEHAFLLAPGGEAFYALVDANYNVVGWTCDTAETGCELDGDAPGAGIVVSQYVYTPYGQPLAVEYPLEGGGGGGGAPGAAFTATVPGHQGLFFIRLGTQVPGGSGIGGGSGAASITPSAWDDTSLTSESVGVYYNRNRNFLPHLGRFQQRDMNETALLILETLASNAATMYAGITGFGTQAHFIDGLNLYAYASSNPLTGSDPLGLYGWDDDIDDLIADRTGHALYTLGTLNEGAKWASLALGTALSVAGSLLPGSGLVDAFNSVQLLLNGAGGFWEALDVATVAFPLAKKGLEGITALRGMFRARGYALRACNCFVPGTLVETSDGPTPIEFVARGDYVLTKHQDDAGNRPVWRPVSRVFRSLAPAIVWMTLSTGETLGVTPGHEVWTATTGWTTAGELRVGDAFVDANLNPVTVVETFLDQMPTVVYNLEVDGAWTYYAQGVWVHNNSCTLAARVTGKFVKHHTIPLQILEGVRRDVRSQMKGLRGARAIIWEIDEVEHKALHGALGDGYKWSGSSLGYGGGAWNARWRAEIHAR